MPTKTAGCNSTYRLRYWHTNGLKFWWLKISKLQQHLPFTVCAEGCETAEEQSDDEVRTSQVPEQSEGKTKMIRKWSLLFTVLKRNFSSIFRWLEECFVAIALTVYGIETRLRHEYQEPFGRLQQYLPFTVLKQFLLNWILNFWPTLVATVLTVYGIETYNHSPSNIRSISISCNRTFRLRYAPQGAGQQRSNATMRAAHRKYLSEVKVKQRK